MQTRPEPNDATREPAESASPPGAMTLVEAMSGRRSVRRFRREPVSEETVLAILDLAARAPSGTNMQPWRVRVVSGAARERLACAVTEAARRGVRKPEYAYYPEDWFEPYLSRRRRVGYDLYGLLGIRREDKDRRTAQHHRNFRLFDAPVGLFFTMDRRLERGSWLDMGMFIGNVMLAARAFGLETCPQAAWVYHTDVVRRELSIPQEEVFLCGMALGRADWEAPENALRTERAPARAFTTFLRD